MKRDLADLPTEVELRIFAKATSAVTVSVCILAANDPDSPEGLAVREAMRAYLQDLSVKAQLAEQVNGRSSSMDTCKGIFVKFLERALEELKK